MMTSGEEACPSSRPRSETFGTGRSACFSPVRNGSHRPAKCLEPGTFAQPVYFPLQPRNFASRVVNLFVPLGQRNWLVRVEPLHSCLNTVSYYLIRFFLSVSKRPTRLTFDGLEVPLLLTRS